MKKQTAVEWFFKWFNDNQEATHKEFAQAFEKAKAMEKEQMKLAYNEDRPFLLGYETNEYFEEHYNENYEKKED